MFKTVTGILLRLVLLRTIDYAKREPTTAAARNYPTQQKTQHQKSTDVIPKPVWAVGFAPEQPLRDATLACSASGISKQLEA
ncbi:MAG: hypothetical protein LBJ00_15530 [Planctomycetaceae bacterium]|nr:hypothetical protein [Planctomycetaceae bacterium]